MQWNAWSKNGRFIGNVGDQTTALPVSAPNPWGTVGTAAGTVSVGTGVGAAAGWAANVMRSVIGGDSAPSDDEQSSRLVTK